MNIVMDAFIAPDNPCPKHPTDPIQYICLNSQYTFNDILMCRSCLQLKSRQKDTVIELKNIRTFIERTVQEKGKKLKEAFWDGVTIEQLIAAHKTEIENQHRKVIEDVEREMEGERGWVRDAFQRSVKSERERRKRQFQRLAVLSYLRGYNNEELVLLKLEVSSDDELYRFRNMILELEKIGEPEYLAARDQQKLVEYASKRVKDRLPNMLAERIKEFDKQEKQKNKELSVLQEKEVNRRAQSRQRSRSEKRRPIFDRTPEKLTFKERERK